MIKLFKALQTGAKTDKIVEIKYLKKNLLTLTANELPSLYTLFSDELLNSDTHYKEGETRVIITLTNRPSKAIFELTPGGVCVHLTDTFILKHQLRDKRGLKNYCESHDYEALIGDEEVILYCKEIFRRD